MGYNWCGCFGEIIPEPIDGDTIRNYIKVFQESANELTRRTYLPFDEEVIQLTNKITENYSIIRSNFEKITCLTPLSNWNQTVKWPYFRSYSNATNYVNSNQFQFWDKTDTRSLYIKINTSTNWTENQKTDIINELNKIWDDKSIPFLIIYIFDIVYIISQLPDC